jgi:hypothetical protein
MGCVKMHGAWGMEFKAIAHFYGSWVSCQWREMEICTKIGK